MENVLKIPDPLALYRQASTVFFRPRAPQQNEITAPDEITAPAVLPARAKTRSIDGCLVFKPPGEANPIGHHMHFHGYSGYSDGEEGEIDLCEKLAAGYFGDYITVIAPVAREIVPSPGLATNVIATFGLIKFVMQHPPGIRKQLTEAIAGKSGNIQDRARNLLETVKSPASWYHFAFKKAPAEAPASGATSSLPANYVLKPDFDKTIDSILNSTRQISPVIKSVLEKTDAVPGRISGSAYSQGVGVLAALALQDPDLLNHMVLISASYIKTEKSPEFSTPIGVDVILPREDPVPDIIGLTKERITKDLRSAFPRGAWVWDQCPGGHSVSGAVADLAGKRIVEASRRSHGAFLVRPG